MLGLFGPPKKLKTDTLILYTPRGYQREHSWAVSTGSELVKPNKTGDESTKLVQEFAHKAYQSVFDALTIGTPPERPKNRSVTAWQEANQVRFGGDVRPGATEYLILAGPIVEQHSEEKIRQALSDVWPLVNAFYERNKGESPADHSEIHGRWPSNRWETDQMDVIRDAVVQRLG